MFKKYFPAIVFFIGYIFVSMGMTLLGPIIPHLIFQYNLTYTSTGLIAGITYIGGAFSFIGGFIASTVGYFWLTILSLLFMSIGLTIFPLTIPTIFMYLSYFLLGVGSGFFETAANPLIAKIYSKRKGMFLNIIHVGWNIGAFIGPLLIGISFIENISWRYVYFISSILLLIEILLLLSLKKYVVSDRVEIKPIFRNKKSYKREVLLFLPIAIGMFLYLGCEQAINVWLPTLIKYRGGSEFLSSISIAVFWITIGIGRIVWSPLIDNFGYSRSLKITTLGILVFSVLGTIQSDPFISLILWGISGLMFAPMFPTIYALCIDVCRKYTGLFSGLLFSIGIIGSFILSSLMGVVIDIWDVNTAFLLTVFFSALSFILFLIIDKIL